MTSPLAADLASDYNDATYFRYTDMMEEVLAGKTMQSVRTALAALKVAAPHAYQAILPASVTEWVGT